MTSEVKNEANQPGCETADTNVQQISPETAPNGEQPDPKPSSYPSAAPRDDNSDDTHQGAAEEQSTAADANGQPAMSKKAMKRLKRKQEWEDQKDERKRRRKEKKLAQKARMRDRRAELRAEAAAAGLDPKEALRSAAPRRSKGQPVPVAFVLDCDFEAYMREKEIISLASQVTRCYSEVRTAGYKPQLCVSSWGGQLRERFETVLQSVHVNWKGVEFVEGDFLEASKLAKQNMLDPSKRGTVVDALKPAADEDSAVHAEPSNGKLVAEPEPPPPEEYKHIVYLSSESPHVLDRLEADTCYIIGGLVDRNREKGLCHRRARQRGVRTARLPIGEYMVMQSRVVLATNHVVEIMLRWLECGDWGEAFMKVVPKRKGGTLRKEDGATGSTSAKAEAAEAEAGEAEDDDHDGSEVGPEADIEAALEVESVDSD